MKNAIDSLIFSISFEEYLYVASYYRASSEIPFCVVEINEDCTLLKNQQP